MTRKRFFWPAVALFGLAIALIQFVPSPPLVVPALLPSAEREAHRLLNFEGIPNFRDLGGYRTRDGRQVRWGSLYRSGTMAEASDADLRALGQLHLSTLIDFRSLAEKTREPNRLPQAPGFDVVEIPILDQGNSAIAEKIMERIDTGDFEGFDPDRIMLNANQQFAVQFTPQFRRFMHSVLEANGEPVVWHCTAGKDRTGFASAVLLRLLGVPEDIVMQDYLASGEQALDARRSQLLLLRLFKGEEAAGKLGILLGVERGWLQAAFDAIDSHWGGFDRYVSEGLQLDASDVAQLKRALLE